MTIPDITIYMDRICTRCGSREGTTERGICLRCVTEEVTAMRPDSQLSLTSEYVDLTTDEKIERGFSLASLLREAQLMADEQAERKKDMKEEREAMEEKIAALAQVVRSGREERPVTRERG